jgi:hypothetical protein
MKKHGMSNLFLLMGPIEEYMDPRRRQEAQDSKLIGQDSGAIANCPQAFINREFDHNSRVEHFKMPKG